MVVDFKMAFIFLVEGLISGISNIYIKLILLSEIKVRRRRIVDTAEVGFRAISCLCAASAIQTTCFSCCSQKWDLFSLIRHPFHAQVDLGVAEIPYPRMK